jgi:hypothetical protein
VTATAVQLPSAPPAGSAGARRYQVEVIDLDGLAVHHIDLPRGLDALEYAHTVWPAAHGLTVSAVIDRH